MGLRASISEWQMSVVSTMLKKDRNFQTIDGFAKCKGDSAQIQNHIKLLTLPKALKYNLDGIENLVELFEVMEVINNCTLYTDVGDSITIFGYFEVDKKNRCVKYSYSLDFIEKIVKVGYFMHTQ